MTAPLEAIAVRVLAEHAPWRNQIGIVKRCRCGEVMDGIKRHRAHVAAVLAEAGVGFVAEAETRRLDMERERNHAEVRAERAEAALEKVRALADRADARADASTRLVTTAALRAAIGGTR